DDLRAPLLLCYFDGLTQDEAAVVLGWKVRTLKDRVARGRETLRSRLTKRGVEWPAALAGPLLAGGLASAVPPTLVAAAVRAAGRRPEVSPAVLALAQTEVSVMTTARLAVACAAVLLAAGGVFALWPGPAADPPTPPPAITPPPPAGVVGIGTNLFRHVGWHA